MDKSQATDTSDRHKRQTGCLEGGFELERA